MNGSESTFVTLSKNPNAKSALTFVPKSHEPCTQVYLSIMQSRIRSKCDEQFGESQFGFRSGVVIGTREVLFA